MNDYALILTIIGVAFMGAGWLPRLLHGRPLSLPIIYVGFGALLAVLPHDLVDADPWKHRDVTERFTELLVIVSLMGAGLKLDRPIGWHSWRHTWRLLGIAMPLTIACAAGVGWWLLGLDPASALLFGAVLAPTDPVLASDVQTGPPGEDDEDDVRFGLTAEAGLNDGLAFPFTHLAVLAATAGLHPQDWWLEWLSFYLLYKVLAGAVCGWLFGSLLIRLIFRTKALTRLAKMGEGFVVLAITLLVYGVTEIVQGYGFLAVFIAAVALRHYERQHEHHAYLHDYIEQSERILMVVALVLFGQAIVDGLFDALTWTGIAAGLMFLFLVRPVSGLLAFIGMRSPLDDKVALSFLGIRGIGSFYYLSYALNHAPFVGGEELWATVGFVVACSVLLHGVSAPLIIARLDAKRRGNEKPS